MSVWEEASQTRARAMVSVRLQALKSLLPAEVPNIPKHYAKLALHRYDKQVPYNAKRFFDSFYGAAESGQLDDRYTIAPEFDPIAAKYHYNALENSIILALRRFPPPAGCRVLDIGSGAGHWIDFYLAYYHPAAVCGMDIAQPAVDFLEQKYSGADEVRALAADVTDPSFALDTRFDVINAMGVLFHIVEDDKWRMALRNLGGCLSDDGVLLVGGQFGPVTQNVQFHKMDDFSSWDEVHSSGSERLRVNKRLRSLHMWKAGAEQVGLAVRHLQLTKRQRLVWTPQNNVLVLSRSARS